MAKSKYTRPESSAPGDTGVRDDASSSMLIEVAMRLFAANWRPRGATLAAVVAAECMDGAEAFCLAYEEFATATKVTPAKEPVESPVEATTVPA